MNDWQLLRTRAEQALYRPPGVRSQGSRAFVGKVISTGAALGPGVFAKITPEVVSGHEIEGGPGSFNSFGSNLLVYNLGPGSLVTGDNTLCRWADYRWVTERSTGSSGSGTGPAPISSIPPCNQCTEMPTSLICTNNATPTDFFTGTYGSFDYTNSVLPSGTVFTWMTTAPSPYGSIIAGQPAFWSPEFEGYISGCPLRLFLSCTGSATWTLNEIYNPTSPSMCNPGNQNPIGRFGPVLPGSSSATTNTCSVGHLALHQDNNLTFDGRSQFLFDG